MDAGLFNWMKTQLEGVLNLVNRMAADGSLQVWAEQAAAKIKTGFEAILQTIKQVQKFFGELAGQVGGFGNLAKIALGVVAAIMSGPLLLAITNVGAALVMLSSLFVANPILLAITAIGAAITLVVMHWDELTNAFATGVENIKRWLVDGVLAGVNAVIDGISGMGRAIKNIMTFNSPFAGGEPLFAAPIASGPSVAPLAANKSQVGGTVKIEVDGPARVKSVQSNNPAVPLNVDAGLSMSGAY